VEDASLVRIAKLTSVVIAIISFFIAPLLQFAPEGLWQIMRIFTGFYNIPIIAIVLVGLFTRRVPPIGPKLVIGFHLVAYTLLQFVFNESINIHFLHLYAVLFVVEVSIMLTTGHFYPLKSAYSFKPRQRVDMTPWEFAPACAITLMSTVFAVYILFSPIGLVDGIGDWFFPILSLIALLNAGVWIRAVKHSAHALA
jgi:SSS family solute:Na+ symporter